MSRQSVWSRWLQGKHRQSPKRSALGSKQKTPPLQLERLEDRVVPAGTWTALTNLAPSVQGQFGRSVGTMELLTDGTVMMQSGDVSSNWYKLTPDSTGNYINGTWSQLASMSIQHLYTGTAVLPSGQVFYIGGEYSGPSGAQNFQNSGQIYDPVANTWSPIATYPQSQFGDDPVEVLGTGPNAGSILAGYISGPQTYLYNPATNTWSAGGTKLRNDQSDEEAWVKLSDGSILSYDIFSSISTGTGHAQRYIPATNTWVDAGTVPVPLSSSSVSNSNNFYELGPGFLLPNGKVFQIGGNSNTALYTPSSNSWVAGPTIPNGKGADDAPGAILPNGDVIFTGDTPYGQTPTQLFQYDPTANSITQLALPTQLNQSLSDNAAFIERMLVLPNGHVLFSDGTTTVWDYNPNVSPTAGSKPTISSIVSNGNLTFTLTGTQLNGISEGAGYGDDAQMATNYPIVQLTSGGTVYDAKTFNWTSQVATGAALVTTQFTLPAGLPVGAYSLTVSANGISSAPFAFTNTLAVSFSNPAAGSTVLAPPTNFVIHFNEAVVPGSVTASELKVNGVNATGVTLNAADTTATFSYSTSPVTTAGAQNMTIAAGLIMGQDSSLNTAFSDSFVYAPGTLTLTPVLPAASLIYSGSGSGTLNFAGDADSFLGNADPGQTLTVLVTPTSPGLQPTIQISDPSATVLGSTSAGGPGQNDLLQTIHTTTSGAYTFTVGGANGTFGTYTVQVYLDAAVEAASVGIGSDTSRATAQDLTQSFVTVQTTQSSASRAAVFGGIGAPPVTLNSANSGWWDSTGFHNDTNPNYFVSSSDGYHDFFVFSLAGITQPITGATLAAFNPSGGYSSSSSSDTYTLFDVTTPLSALEATNLGQTAIYNDLGSGTSYGNTTVTSASNNNTVSVNLNASGLSALNADLGGSFAVGGNLTNNSSALFGGTSATGRQLNLTFSDPNSHFYSFTLGVGDEITVGLKNLTGSGDTLTLEDANGNPLATGVANATNLDLEISNYVAATAGTYFLVVADPASYATYSLVLTRNAALDTEPNSTFNTAQNLAGNKQVLGKLTDNTVVVAPTAYGNTETGNGNAYPFSLAPYNIASMRYQQIYDPSVFSAAGVINSIQFRRSSGQGPFTSTPITISISLGYAATTVTTASPTFANNIGAGGLVNVYNGTFVLSSTAANSSPQAFDIIFNLMHNFAYNPAQGSLLMDITVSNSPGGTFFLEVTPNGGQTQTTRIYSVDANAPTGTLGFTGGANPPAYGLVTAFGLVAAPQPDWYKVTLASGQTALDVRTNTPLGGPSQPLNALNPNIQLYNSSDVLIANGSLLSDGRNQGLVATGLTPGATYYIAVAYAPPNGTPGQFNLGLAFNGPVTVTGGSTGNFVLQRVISGGLDDLQLLQNGVVIDERSTALVTSYTVNAGAANESLTINYTASGGFFNIPVTFNGGGGTDPLTITGGSFTTDTYNFTNAANGNIHLDSTIITYTVVSAVTNTGTAANDIFNLPNAGNSATLQDEGTTGNGLSQLVSTGTFASTTFEDPTSSATINSFAGTTNTITVSSTAPPADFDAALTIAGNSATDTVNLNGALTLGHAGGNTGNLSITANTINVNSTIKTTAGSVGLVTLTAGAAITASPGADITAPSVSLSAGTSIGAANALTLTTSDVVQAIANSGSLDLALISNASTGPVTVGFAEDISGAFTITQTGGQSLTIDGYGAGGVSSALFSNSGANLTVPASVWNTVTLTLQTIGSGNVIFSNTGVGSTLPVQNSGAIDVISAGSITQTGSTADEALSSGTVNLTAAGNIGPITVVAPTLTAMTSSGFINATDNLATATAATLTDTGAGTVTFAQVGGGATTVTATANAAITLSNTGAALTATSVNTNGGGNVSITTTTSGNITLGVVTATGQTVTATSAGAIIDTGAISTGSGGNVFLTASGAVSESGAGSISTGTLTTTSAGGTTLGGANAITTFTASNTSSGDITLTNTVVLLHLTGSPAVSNTAANGNVSITNSGGIETDGVVSTAASGNISLTANSGGNITLKAAVTAGGTGNVTLTATANIDGTGGSVTTGGLLTTTSVGGMLLTNTNLDHVASFTATNTGGGNVQLFDTSGTGTLTVLGISTTGASAVTVGNVGNLTTTTGSIITANGAILLETGNGASNNISVGSAVIAGSGGNITLTTNGSTGTISETAPGDLATTGLLTTSSVGGTTLNLNNTVGSFTASNTTSGDISLTDEVVLLHLTGSPAVSNTAATGKVSVTNSGGITVNGAVNTVGGALTLSGNAAGTAAGSFTGVAVLALVTSATGAISLTGHGGTAGGYGVLVQQGGIGTTTGASPGATISINGTGGGGTGGNGVLINGFGGSGIALVSTAAANIQITGQGGAGTGGFQTGVSIYANGQVTAGGNGSVTIQGTGGGTGSSFQDIGFIVSQNGAPGTPLVSAVNGAVLITGTGGSASGGDEFGVLDNNSGLITTTGTGGITVNGTGKGGALGVYVTSSGSLTAGVGSTASLAITGGFSAADAGVRVDAGSSLSATGAMSVTANAGNIVLNGPATAGGTMTLLTNGNAISGGATLTANTLFMTAPGTIGANGSPIHMSVTNLNTGSGGNQFLSAADIAIVPFSNGLFSSGTIELDAGTFQVDSSTVAALALNGGNLSGTGTVGTVSGPGTVPGVVAPGDGSTIGTLDSGTETWGSGTTFFVNLTHTSNNLLAITGSIALGGATLFGLAAPNIQLGDKFTIITTTGTVSGQFAGGSTATIDGLMFTVQYNPTSVVLTRNSAAPVFTNGPPTSSVAAGSQYSFQFTATNGPTFSLSNAPSFLSIDPNTGVLMGTSTLAATYNNITITATNSAGFAQEMFNLTVTPLAANHLVVSGPQAVNAGTGYIYTVTAQDMYNNTDTNYGYSVTLTPTDLAAIVSNNGVVTMTAGVGTGTVTWRSGGTFSLNASGANPNGGGNIMGAENNIVSTLNLVQTGGVIIDDGTGQRSMVRSVTLTFQGNVNVPASVFALSVMNAANLSGAGVTFAVSSTLVSGNTVAVLTFLSDPGDGAMVGGSLFDGQYVLSLQGNTIKSFWRLFGDGLGTGQVTTADQTLFNAAYGSRKGQPKYNSIFDYDSNGLINGADRGAFQANLGMMINAQGLVVPIG